METSHEELKDNTIIIGNTNYFSCSGFIVDNLHDMKSLEPLVIWLRRKCVQIETGSAQKSLINDS